MSGHNKYMLTAEILARSESDVWDAAKLEWVLVDIYQDTEGTCLCSHKPITDHCVLSNIQNGNQAIVGSVCVKKFIGLPSDKIFRSLKNMQEDTSRSAGQVLIEYASDKGWLNQWERDFCLDTRLKRSLSDKQETKRRGINEKLLYIFKQKKGGN